MTREPKDQRFRRVAVARVNKIIKMVRLIGNCSNKAMYDYSEREVEKIFSTLRAEIDAAEKRFLESRETSVHFSLDEDIAED